MRMKGTDRRIDTPMSDREKRYHSDSEQKGIQGKKSERYGKYTKPEEEHPFFVEYLADEFYQKSLIDDGNDSDESETISYHLFIERESVREKERESGLHGRKPKSKDKSEEE